MATGSDKTRVMAFLMVTPGITIRDRLGVLLPTEPDNYYEMGDIVLPEMPPDIRRAEIVITSCHTFLHQETIALSKVARSLMRAPAP
jgi:type III restriction enzyme